MGLIPLDEPRGDGSADGPDGPEDTSLIGRLRSGLAAVLLAFPGLSTLAAEPASEPSEPLADTGEGGTDTDRHAPAALPGGPNDGEVDVVSTETDDTLTVEAVDNPDATISSDTWEPVER